MTLLGLWWIRSRSSARERWARRLAWWFRRCLVAGLLMALVGGVVGGVLAWVLPLPSALRTAPSTVVRYEDGSLAHVFLSPDDKWRIQADLERIDPAYV
ncbi:MAG: hypothetical protein QGG40_04515, partial [Myxococcota bacterium]|nr:hypothetical protein [Myxococcota bacterium]